jgi:hypothetical protein
MHFKGTITIIFVILIRTSVGAHFADLEEMRCSKAHPVTQLCLLNQRTVCRRNWMKCWSMTKCLQSRFLPLILSVTTVINMDAPYILLFLQYISANWAIIRYLTCLHTTVGARVIAVAMSTVLQAGNSRAQFPIKSLNFSIYLILPAALWTCGRLSL